MLCIHFHLPRWLICIHISRITPVAYHCSIKKTMDPAVFNSKQNEFLSWEKSQRKLFLCNNKDKENIQFLADAAWCLNFCFHNKLNKRSIFLNDGIAQYTDMTCICSAKLIVSIVQWHYKTDIIQANCKHSLGIHLNWNRELLFSWNFNTLCSFQRNLITLAKFH